MNREIKFRVWDREFKEMLYDGIMLSISSGNVYANYKTGSIKAFPKDSYDLMQYIGLKDSNGKEIYEGDIIKGHWLPLDLIAEVYYDIDSCAYRYKGIQIPDFDCAIFKQGIEILDPLFVIGNIFENKELLK